MRNHHGAAEQRIADPQVRFMRGEKSIPSSIHPPVRLSHNMPLLLSEDTFTAICLNIIIINIWYIVYILYTIYHILSIWYIYRRAS